MAAAAEKGKAARSEKKAAPKTRTLDFRGVKVTTPEKLPGDLAFEIGEAEVNGESGLGLLYRIMRTTLSPEDFEAVRNKVRELDVPFDEMETVLRELTDDILGKAGSSTGESEASAGS